MEGPEARRECAQNSFSSVGSCMPAQAFRGEPLLGNHLQGGVW